MAETAAHLVDHVFPPLPVRQWVLAVPKRLRYFLQPDAALQGTVLTRVRINSPGEPRLTRRWGN